MATSLLTAANELKQQGNEYFLQEKYPEAIKLYNEAILLEPKSVIFYSNRSAAFFENGQFSEALKDATRAEQLDPSFPKVYIRQHQAYYKLGIPAMAEHCLKKGIKQLPQEQRLKSALKEFYETDDGDQTLIPGVLPGTPAAKMRDFQGEQGMRMHTEEALAELPSPAHVAAFKGDIETFMREFDPPRHSNLRCWGVKLPLTSLIISGAQRMHYLPHHSLPLKHEEIMEMVVQNGWCRVDAKDIAGYTALHHIASRHANLELARQLLEFGANPNNKNRFEDGALLSALMAKEYGGVALLLQYGADPYQRDPTGMVSAEYMAERALPEAIPLIQKAKKNTKRVVETNETSGDDSSKFEEKENNECNYCGKPEAENKCNKCRQVMYCSKKCRKADFNSHKKTCLKKKTYGKVSWNHASNGQCVTEYSAKPENVLKCKTENLHGMSLSLQGRGMSSVNSSTSLFLKPRTVKVQVGLYGDTHPMLVYDKERNLYVYVSPSTDAGKELARIVRSCEYPKAYFKAWIEKEGEIVIDKTVLPSPNW